MGAICFLYTLTILGMCGTGLYFLMIMKKDDSKRFSGDDGQGSGD